MKKMNFLICLILVAASAVCQKADKPSNTNKFYASAEDFKNNKPMPGLFVSLATWRNVLGNETVDVSSNGKPEKTKISKLPTPWFCNDDGVLMRAFDGDLYYLVIAGPISYYIRRDEGTADISPSGGVFAGRLSKDSYVPADYYSETINGEIKKLKSKTFKKLLKQYDLDQKYKSEKVKREMRDSVDDYASKKKTKTAKYIKLLNEKMK